MWSLRVEFGRKLEQLDVLYPCRNWKVTQTTSPGRGPSAFASFTTLPALLPVATSEPFLFASDFMHYGVSILIIVFPVYDTRTAYTKLSCTSRVAHYTDNDCGEIFKYRFVFRTIFPTTCSGRTELQGLEQDGERAVDARIRWFVSNIRQFTVKVIKRL